MELISSPPKLKIACQMTMPRYGANVALHSIYTALHENGLWVAPSYGVYWTECMEIDFERLTEAGANWILTIDSDSMIRPSNVKMMLTAISQQHEIEANQQTEFPNRQPIDAFFAKQSKRHCDDALGPHFGLTALRVDRLQRVEKPWFHAVPNADKTWQEGSIDADRQFWRKWKACGNSVGCLEQCRIGHLQETIAQFDENGEHQIVTMEEWLSNPC